jgi:hypothetical protein
VQTLIHTRAFDFDELRFDWGDVVLAAIGWGEWQLLERSLACGLACATDAAARGEEVEEAELHAAVIAFRRARALLAGDDYLRWLAERSLTPADLAAHLTRAALARRAGGRLDRVLADHAPAAAKIAGTIRGEAILGDRLHPWAERLARSAAAARGLAAAGDDLPVASGDAVAALVEAATSCPASGLHEAEARDRAPRVASLHAAEHAFSDAVATRERIERCLAEHRLDWQRLVWEEVTFAGEGAAREVALWVREDGMALGAAAAMAHAAAEVREAYCSDVPELSGLLVAAAPGELAGPLAGEDGWQLLRLLERTAPVIDDAAVAERAGTVLVADAIERHLAGRVRWHDER